MEMAVRNALTIVRGAIWPAALIFIAFSAQASPALTARSGPVIFHGDSPRLLVSGLAPGETIVVHSYRLALQHQPEKPPVTILAHAFAEFAADGQGRIDVNETEPLYGTYSGRDSLGLLWSGEKSDPVPGLKLSSANEVVFEIERQSKVVAQTRINFTDGADQVVAEQVAQPGLNGAFAHPTGTGPWPALILLHGSGGGGRDAARAWATQFARLGYAVFALNYFAPPHAPIDGVPQEFVNIPVEVVGKARAWMQARPNVRADHVALLGTSKGAELALIAASHFDWVDRVVACAPSDVVWSGFGRMPAPGEEYSSWTLAGRPLPYIPYLGEKPFEDFEQGRLSVAAIHVRSFVRTPADRVEAARIPIEHTKAKLLLLGASRDELWPSGDMTRRIEKTMKEAGLGGQVSALVFEGSGHFFFAGTGDQPTRINPGIKPEGDKPLPEATARASAQAWQETKWFLAQ